MTIREHECPVFNGAGKPVRVVRLPVTKVPSGSICCCLYCGRVYFAKRAS